jgi:RNA polymerase sigma-70 factor (ECF subfamily)
VVLCADGGGKARGAATRPVRGRIAVARFSIGATRRFLPASPCVDLAEVNAAPALIFRDGDRTLLVLSIDVVGQRVQTVRIIANPDKLAHV